MLQKNRFSNLKVRKTQKTFAVMQVDTTLQISCTAKIKSERLFLCLYILSNILYNIIIIIVLNKRTSLALKRCRKTP